MTEKTVRTAGAGKTSQPRPNTVRTKTGKPRQQKPARTTISRPALILRALAITFVTICLVLGLAAGLAYVRLQHGPIALTPLLSTIESAMSSELGGKTLKVGAAELRRAESGRYEFGLRDVQVREPDGAVIAIAPAATAALSYRALRRARIALERVDLVGPRLQLFYADDGSLSVSMTPSLTQSPPDNVRSAPASMNPAQPLDPATSPPADRQGRINVIKALAQAGDRARRREDSSAFLREFGLINATVIVDDGKRKSIWRLPDLSIDLAHNRASSVVEGKATIAAFTGPFDVAFSLVESGQAETLQLALRVSGLVPRGLARTMPQFALLDAIDAPLNGEARFDVSATGAIQTGTMRLTLAPGQIQLPGAARTPLPLSGAELNLTYNAAASRIELQPSRLAWAESEVRLAGRATYSQDARAAAGWTFEIGAIDGSIGGEPGQPARIPIERFNVQGSVATDPGNIQISQFQFKAGGADIAAEGSVSDFDQGPGPASGSMPRIDINGRISPMPVAALKTIWPAALAPTARQWLRTNLTKGQITKGTFRIATPSPTGSPANRPEPKLSLSFDTAGTEVLLNKGLPPLDIPRATLRFEGQALELTAADAFIGAGETKRLNAKAIRLTATDSTGAEQPAADIAFRLIGPLAGAVDLADRDPFNLLKASGIAIPGLEGKIDGTVRIQVPLVDNLQISEIKTDGRIRITDVRTRQAFGNYDVNGGAIAIDLNDKAIDIKGDLLVKGVPAKLSAQYLLNIPADRQPPLRVTAVLDNADRTQLGFDINDIVQGEIPIEMTASREKSETQIRVRADLSKSELLLEHLAWRKPAGRPALLQFDVAKGQGQGAAARTELQNIKIAGDDVAIEGFMAIGPDNRLREYFFPEFSINTVSRLEVQGKLRGDNVWDVKAKGTTFDGRDFFRGLFSLGQLAQRKTPPKHAGIDLNAEIDTVLGFSESSIKSVKVRSQTRGEKMVGLEATGQFERGKPFRAIIQSEPNTPRRLLAESQDAGQIFKLVGFYPRAVGGIMNLEVDLDGSGSAEKTGILWARNFAVLGDSIVGDVLQNADTGQPAIAGKNRRKTSQELIAFDVMKIPFSVGNGQFVMNDAQIKGPLLGAPFRGKIDFKAQTVDLGGSYIPLAGLNSAISGIPIVGLILGGAKGEGVFGMPFAIQGALANPQVTVNPAGLVAPGIFKDIFQLTPDTYRIDPRQPAAPAKSPAKAEPSRASSSTPAGSTPAPAPPAKTPVQRTKPEVLGDWSTETQGSKKK